MSSKFRLVRKIPVIVGAWEYKKDDIKNIPEKLLRNISTKIGTDKIYINTLEGEMEASVGDWIICGIKGEFYPCKPDVFAKTYEILE
jgi:hypothetical protein